MTQEQRRAPYVCVFEDVPKGFPIGADVSERIVFNGYFLKLMQYEASDVTRGAPVLIGRIGWEPHESATRNVNGVNSSRRLTLIGLGVMFFLLIVRWAVQLRGLFTRRTALQTGKSTPKDDLDPAALSHWLEKVGQEDSELPTPRVLPTGEQLHQPASNPSCDDVANHAAEDVS